jgi:hypothetical protein
MTRRSAFIVVVVWLLPWGRCVSPTQEAGTGSGGESRFVAISGTVQYAPGAPASNLRARIRPSGYLKGYTHPGLGGVEGTSYDTFTDDSGRFHFVVPDSVEYRIEITNERDSAVLIDATAEGEAVHLDAASMAACGGMAGCIDGGAGIACSVVAYGTEHSVVVDDTGGFVFGRLPAGLFTVRFACGDTAVGLTVADVRVESGSVTSVGSFTWSPSGCGDYRCDSICVAAVLSANGLSTDSVSAVSTADTATGRIVGADLRGRGLHVLPDAIAGVSHLRSLYLNDNMIAELPASIGDLDSLRTLSLTANRLEYVPASLGQLDSLESLVLNSNILDSVVDLSGLGALTVLDLGSNALAELPLSVTRLASLTELHINGNQLPALPSGISGLTNLRVLTAGNNRLTSVSTEIGGLDSLRRLDLNDNQLQTIPSSVGRLTSLRFLFLGANELSALPEELTALQSLSMLTIGHNRLCDTMSLSLTQWADENDPGWRETQVCD